MTKQFEGNLPDARVQFQMGAMVFGSRQSSEEETAPAGCTSAIVAAAAEALHTRGIGWRQMLVVHVRPLV
jgi:hypothetical protein